MKNRWSAIAGLPVVSSEEEKILGKLRAVFVHPETGQILAFLVGWLRVVTPRDISQWTQEQVTINSAEDLTAPEEILRLREFGLQRTLFNGKKVLTKSGKRLGRVKDFSFDTASDHLLTLDSAKSFLFWEWAQRSFPAKLINEITDSAIVLSTDEEQKEKVTEKATLSVAV